MAKPAFIYAFDNLGPDHFTELCALLLGTRYRGFILGGVGADGGVDAELDQHLAFWNSEIKDALLNEIIRPGQQVVFQFKHIVTGRVGGQTKARENLLGMYKCRDGYACEIHRELILKNRFDYYVLVTNVEVNSRFRDKFIEQCKTHNQEISSYQIIGLDELEMWVSSDVELRHLFFPTIFGPPRFNLQVKVSEGVAVLNYGRMVFGKATSIFFVSVLNIGSAPSYISSVAFKAILDGQEKILSILNFNDEFLKKINPESGAIVEPGRKLDYRFPFELLKQMKTLGREIFPFEVLVYDEIGNIYTVKIPEDLIARILE
jgi:hypothetical protein